MRNHQTRSAEYATRYPATKWETSNVEDHQDENGHGPKTSMSGNLLVVVFGWILGEIMLDFHGLPARNYKKQYSTNDDNGNPPQSKGRRSNDWVSGVAAVEELVSDGRVHCAEIGAASNIGIV